MKVRGRRAGIPLDKVRDNHRELFREYDELRRQEAELDEHGRERLRHLDYMYFAERLRRDARFPYTAEYIRKLLSRRVFKHDGDGD